MEAHRGTLILVLGILSIVLCQILGPFAWVMGNNDLKKIAAGTMDPEGQQTTNAGKICGIIGTILGILLILFWIAYAIFIFVIIGAGAGAGALEGMGQ